MTEKQAERIVKVLTALKVKADVIQDYSGKFMYGRLTTAIVCGDEVTLGYAAAKARVPYKDLPKRTDGMGLSNIHY